MQANIFNPAVQNKDFPIKFDSIAIMLFKLSTQAKVYNWIEYSKYYPRGAENFRIKAMEESLESTETTDENKKQIKIAINNHKNISEFSTIV